MSLTHGTVLDHLGGAELDTAPLSLLTTGNPKTAKGEGLGYLTAILHMSPARLAGFEVCAWRTDGCTDACLNVAGRGSMEGLARTIHVARLRRTRYFKRDRLAFGLMLERDIMKHARYAATHGLTPVVRLNGTSDLPYENARFEWADGTTSTVFERFAGIQFYDYTKGLKRLERPLPANYDLTFSLAESNEQDAHRALELGHRVAVVLRDKTTRARKWKLPTQWRGRPVIDADETDLRFLEPGGVWCGLRAKGLAKTDTTGFVYDV